MPTIDFNPFAVFASPALLFIYCAMAVYLSICFGMGFMAARANRNEFSVGGLHVNRTGCFVLSGVGYSLLFTVFIVPIVIIIGFWTLLGDSMKRWCEELREKRRRDREMMRMRRGGDAGQPDDVEMGEMERGESASVINDGSTWTPTEIRAAAFQPERLPPYVPGDCDALENSGATVDTAPQVPPPVYVQGQERERVSLESERSQ